jgi:hypothetical protein
MELKSATLFLIPLSLYVSSTQAAELAGRIWFENNNQAASNFNVIVTCEQDSAHSGTSDNYGFYRVPSLPANKACVVVINSGQRQSAPLQFNSGQGRDTQNFSLVVQGNQFIVRKR